MGLAASQARYLSLVARQTNLEYQGQQINQERTILSQQVSTLYNNLLELEVPTPPSTSDFTKIVYSGTDGASQFTIGTVLPSTKKSGAYKVELKTETTGPSLATQYNRAVVQTKSEEIPCSAPPAGQSQTTSITDYYVLNNDGSIRKATGVDFVIDNTGSAPVYIFKNGVNYLVKDPSEGVPTYHYEQTTVAGQEVMSFREAEAKYPTDFKWDEYKNAIRNSFASKDGEQEITEDNFDVFFTTSSSGITEVHLVLASEVELGKTATVYDYSIGTYTKSEQKDECELEFDELGRITAINVPVYQEGSSDPVMYNRISLTAETITDTNAYNDAYAQYQYQQYLYDKEQQEINRKTELIQSEDKNLELKLTRLDSERQMIEKELEAVKKVLEDNIENSFKTFSG